MDKKPTKKQRKYFYDLVKKRIPHIDDWCADALIDWAIATNIAIDTDRIIEIFKKGVGWGETGVKAIAFAFFGDNVDETSKNKIIEWGYNRNIYATKPLTKKDALEYMKGKLSFIAEDMQMFRHVGHSYHLPCTKIIYYTQDRKKIVWELKTIIDISEEIEERYNG